MKSLLVLIAFIFSFQSYGQFSKRIEAATLVYHSAIEDMKKSQFDKAHIALYTINDRLEVLKFDHPNKFEEDGEELLQLVRHALNDCVDIIDYRTRNFNGMVKQNKKLENENASLTRKYTSAKGQNQELRKQKEEFYTLAEKNKATAYDIQGNFFQFLLYSNFDDRYKVWLTESGEILNLIPTIEVLIENSIDLYTISEKKSLIQSLQIMPVNDLVELFYILGNHAQQIMQSNGYNPNIETFLFVSSDTIATAEKLYISKDYDSAIGLLKILNAKEPGNENVIVALAACYLKKSDSVQFKNYSSKIESLDAHRYYRMGRIFQNKGMHHFAQFLFSKSYELEPNNENLLSSYGTCLNEIGDYQMAFELYSKLITIDPNNADYFDGLGYSALKQGDTDIAREHFSKSLELYPNSAWTYRMISKSYKKDGNYQLAYDTDHISISKGLNAYFGLSWHCLFLGKFDESLEASANYIEKDPLRTSIYTNVALAHLLKGDLEAAKEVYTTWKDKAYVVNPYGYKVFRDAFLADLEDIEEELKKGNMPHAASVNFKQVRSWLK